MPEVITFYSDRSGVGASVVFANVGALLSSWNYRVLCVNFAPDRAELPLHFKPFSWTDAGRFADAIATPQSGAWRSFVNMPTPSGERDAPAQPHMLDVAEGAKVDWAALYEKNEMGNRLEEVREEWKDEYDFVLINSPSGSGDLAAICTVQLPDALIVVAPSDQQSFRRTTGVVNGIIKARQELPFERGGLIVVPLVTLPLEHSGDPSAKVEQQLLAFTMSWHHQSVGDREFLNQLIIPDLSGQAVAPVAGMEKDERDEDIANRLESLASIIAHGFSDVDVLVEARDAYVAGAMRPPAAAAMTPVREREATEWLLAAAAVRPFSPWTVLPAAKAEGAYKYYIDTGGRVLPAYLTYALYPWEGEWRSILLTVGSEDLLHAGERAEFRRLAEELKEYAGGRVSTAKNIVNRIVDRETDLPNVKVVVHKFGPVPVYVPPRSLIVDSLAGYFPVRIGLYPRNVFPAASRFGSSKSEFIQSLTIGLGLMFRRYLEDVGEAMYNIANHLDHAEVFSRAKEIEIIFGESVVTKLQAVIPSPESFHQPSSEHEILVNRLFSEERYWILIAEYARTFALFFLNELYRHMGLGAHSEIYFGKFAEVNQRFDRLLGEGFASQAREGSLELTTLHNVLQDYAAGRYEEMAYAAREPSQMQWVTRFVNFAAFISRLNQTKVSPTEGRVFISHLRNLESEAVKASIASRVASRFAHSATVLQTNGDSHGVRFGSLAKSRIWLSDTVFAVMVGDSHASPGETRRDYLRVAAEVQYGLLLGKRVVALVDEGVSAGELKDWLATADMRHLMPGENLSRQVAQYALPQLADLPTLELRKGALSVEDKPLVLALEEELWMAIERRHAALIYGWLSLFTRETRRTVGHINQLARYLTTKRTLARRMHKVYPEFYRDEKAAGKAIRRAWEVAQKRVLLIDGQPQTLIRMSRKSRKGHPAGFTGNLKSVLKKLRPDLGPAGVEDWAWEIFQSESAPSRNLGEQPQAGRGLGQHFEFSDTLHHGEAEGDDDDMFSHHETRETAAMITAWR